MDSFMVNMLHFSEPKKEEAKIAQPETSMAPGTVSFEELLSSSMKQVNDLQLESDKMVQRLATGDVEDISEVVLASSRAEIALKMFMELRNRFVDAYQQLSRMSA
ncbi:MAG: flagellar hook-basal body complex protein FliE [Synergistaceae bacterium]|jgi:flagellar hook-basal body complex protein FliE|nr:flagellar hook-basal body complex protein FliE [Synergistaceae bacterium]